jgi:hypothetical protein
VGDAQVGLSVSRFGVELARQCEHRSVRQHSIERNRQLRFIAFRDPPYPLFEIVGRLQDESALLQEFLARRSKPRPVAVGPKQRKAQVFFKLLYRVRDGGRYAKQFVGRARKAASAIDCIDDLKTFERRGPRYNK